MFRFYYFWSSISLYTSTLGICGLFQFLYYFVYENDKVTAFLALAIPFCLILLSKISTHKVSNIFDDVQHSKKNHIEVIVEVMDDGKINDKSFFIGLYMIIAIAFICVINMAELLHLTVSMIIPYIILFLLYIIYAYSNKVFPNVELGYSLSKCKIIDVIGEYPDAEIQAIKQEQCYIFHTKRGKIQKAIILGDKNRASESHFCLAERA